MIYDGYDFSNILRVERIGRPAIAPINARVDDDEGFDGGFEEESTLEPKVIEVEVRLVRPFEDEFGLDGGFEYARRILGAHLFRRKYCKLVLRDAPDLYEMAKLDSSTDIEEFVYSRTVTLTFICHPASYGATRQKTKEKGGTAKAMIDGDYKTFPRVEVDADGPFQVLFDDAIFEVTDLVKGKVLIDAQAHTVTCGDSHIAFSVYSLFPEWKPGGHEVGCERPFVVSWEERWL